MSGPTRTFLDQMYIDTCVLSTRIPPLSEISLDICSTIDLAAGEAHACVVSPAGRRGEGRMVGTVVSIADRDRAARLSAPHASQPSGCC